MTRTISLLLIAGLFLLTGCEAVKGLGRDFQKAGKWMEKTTQKNN